MPLLLCRMQLRSLSLGGLFIPGTHNSACYKSSFTRTDIFSRYLLTQDTDVWGQLVHGIRYLDLRVGYYPPGNKNQTKDHGNRYVPIQLVLLYLQVQTTCSLKEK